MRRPFIFDRFLCALVASLSAAFICTGVARTDVWVRMDDAVLKTVNGQQLPRTSWTAMGQKPVPVFTAAQQTELLTQITDTSQAIAAAMATIAAAATQKQSVLQK
jgi:hypothetical protein